jgi:hypothetical protein
MLQRIRMRILVLGLVAGCVSSPLDAALPRSLVAVLQQKCLKCHGGDEVNGEVDFRQINTAEKFRGQPKMIDRMINAIADNSMPPEDEPPLDEKTQAQLLATLKAMLREATAGKANSSVRIRRLNRFQYNNTVKDLFQLKQDLFGLREKLMTRYDNYLHRGTGKMPDVVQVASHSLKPQAGLRDVNPFPKDARANHGFDNQANQLTLSPLLLDAFLRLSVSLVESPDFNEKNVGVWKDLFQAPADGTDQAVEAKRRLETFLKRAFRGPVDEETVGRYVAYNEKNLGSGLPFTESMKKVVSAVLSSPRFLYRTVGADASERQFELASNLSYVLWGSCPDDELLQLAETGELSREGVLQKTVLRMMADPRIERFLDTFPSQWMQLENVLAATPDPQLNRYFNLDRQNPASLQMVLEPLLLFDTVFLEDRPIVELIAPGFGYQSSFLEDWYKTRLEPEPVDEVRIAKENKQRNEVIRDLQASLAAAREELAGLDRAMTNPIAEKRIEVDLSPGQVAWEKAQAKLVDEAVVLSAWSRIGPFAGGNLDNAHAKAFIDETAVDLTKTYGDKKWVEVKEYVDGKVHALLHANCATYIYRTIHAKSARSLQLSLGSDDSFKLWLNGQLVADKKITRGVAPDQDKVRVELLEGDNTLLMKISNGGGGYGFYFKAQSVPLPAPVVAALQVAVEERTEAQGDVITKYYLSVAPELAQVRREIAESRVVVVKRVQQLDDQFKKAPKPKDVKQHRADAQRRFDDQLRGKMRSRAFKRMAATDARYGGVITNAAMLSMTSGPKRTHPVARGVWIIEVIFNDPPAPPPNDVPPLNEDAGDKDQTIREKFAAHRDNPSCAGCHTKLDPLGFAMENYDITGRWRDQYRNGRAVDASGTLMRKHPFDGAVKFKQSLIRENERFARAFISHLLRFALSRELDPSDTIAIDAIVEKTRGEDFKLQSLIREVVLSKVFVARE